MRCRPSISRVSCIALVLLVGQLDAGSALALDPQKRVSQYVFDTWQT